MQEALEEALRTLSPAGHGPGFRSGPGPGRTEGSRRGRPLIGAVTPLDLLGTDGPLRASDLERYRSDGPGAPCVIQTVSHRHHRIAQLAALGHSQVDIARAVSMTPVAISLILRSPATRALLEQYQQEMRDADHAFQIAVGVVRDKTLEQVSADLDLGALRGKDAVSALTCLMDRTGHGPTSTVNSNSRNTSIHTTLKEVLEAHKSQQARIIEEPIDLQAEPPEDLKAFIGGSAPLDRAILKAKASKAEGLARPAGPGTDL